MRNLLLGEAAVLGGLGALGGVPLGLLTAQVQAWMLHDAHLVPAGFAAPWRHWILAVSAATGMLLAILGVLAASRRAVRVRPLEALGADAPSLRSLGRLRRTAGGGFGLAALLLTVLAPLGGPAGGQAMAMCVSVCAVLSFACFAPRLVPALARLLPVRRNSAVAHLVKSELRDDAWRSASTAAPVIVLIGLVLGQSILRRIRACVPRSREPGTTGLSPCKWNYSLPRIRRSVQPPPSAGIRASRPSGGSVALPTLQCALTWRAMSHSHRSSLRSSCGTRKRNSIRLSPVTLIYRQRWLPSSWASTTHSCGSRLRRVGMWTPKPGTDSMRS